MVASPSTTKRASSEPLGASDHEADELAPELSDMAQLNLSPYTLPRNTLPPLFAAHTSLCVPQARLITELKEWLLEISYLLPFANSKEGLVLAMTPLAAPHRESLGVALSVGELELVFVCGPAGPRFVVSLVHNPRLHALVQSGGPRAAFITAIIPGLMAVFLRAKQMTGLRGRLKDLRFRHPTLRKLATRADGVKKAADRALQLQRRLVPVVHFEGFSFLMKSLSAHAQERVRQFSRLRQSVATFADDMGLGDEGHKILNTSSLKVAVGPKNDIAWTSWNFSRLQSQSSALEAYLGATLENLGYASLRPRVLGASDIQNRTVSVLLMDSELRFRMRVHPLPTSKTQETNYFVSMERLAASDSWSEAMLLLAIISLVRHSPEFHGLILTHSCVRLLETLLQKKLPESQEWSQHLQRLTPPQVDHLCYSLIEAWGAHILSDSE